MIDNCRSLFRPPPRKEVSFGKQHSTSPIIQGNLMSSKDASRFEAPPEGRQTMNDNPNLWRRTRIDVLTHRRTHWFSAIEHNLRLQCQCANRAGVLERSMTLMARVASGDAKTLTVTPPMIRAAITRLSASGHVQWFPEAETLWWVNMADEQQPDLGTNRAKFWTQLGHQLGPKLVNQVRVAVQTRYPDLKLENTSDRRAEGPAPPNLETQLGFLPLKEKEKEEERERTKSRSDLEPPSPRRRRPGSQPSRVVDPALIDAVIDCANEHRAAVIAGTRGLRRDSKCQRSWVAKATLREQATLEHWQRRLAHLAQAAANDDFWRPHLSSALEHLHRAKNWERWAHHSAVPLPRLRALPDFAPRSFQQPEHRTERGDGFGPNLDPNSEEP